MNEKQLFARIPRTVFEALRHEEITQTMFSIMCQLHMWANWNTGVARSVRASRLYWALGGDDGEDVPSERTIQRHLQGLIEAGWLLSDYRKGSKRAYSITITNFMPPKGQDAEHDADKFPLNKTEIKGWRETSIVQGADRDADKTVTRRGQGAEKATKPSDCNQISNQISFQTSNEISVGFERTTELSTPSANHSSDTNTKEEETTYIDTILLERFRDTPPTTKETDTIILLINDNNLDNNDFITLLNIIIKLTLTKGWAAKIETVENLIFRLRPNPATGKSALLEQARKAFRGKKRFEGDNKSVDYFNDPDMDDESKPTPANPYGLPPPNDLGSVDDEPEPPQFICDCGDTFDQDSQRAYHWRMHCELNIGSERSKREAEEPSVPVFDMENISDI